MKKSLFERMGLVERVEPSRSSSHDNYEDYEDADYEPTPTVNTVATVTEDLIGDIYTSNGMDDLSRSIFKVEEVNMSLPDTMPTETKRMAITGILSSFNLTVGEVLNDAANRRSTVNAAANAMMEEQTNAIEDLDTKIEDLRKQIQTCEAQIKEHESKHAFIRQTAEAEIKRIDALVDFLDGDADKGKENNK